ncbi:KEOPS complex subunit Pcc1 [Caldisphaera lagunensis]|nr:KEOPS complex subunit Pcc1 [Caldisphaera lagunensis]
MEVNFKICSNDKIDPLYKSLLAEVNQSSPKKGKVRVELNDNCINLFISSNTLSGLRAISNSYLNLIYAIINSLSV